MAPMRAPLWSDHCFPLYAALQQPEEFEPKMLEEWIRNLPVDALRQIAEDPKVEGSRIWQLAVVEMLLRQNQAALAA